MTEYLWDTSHFDGPLSFTTMAQARDEGIVALTHKLAEGTTDTEGTSDDVALAAARDVGIEFLGGYLVPRTYTSVQAQVDFWLQIADASAPWWRDFPGWFWQVDLERWSYDNVSASVGIAAAQELRDRTGRWTILYASHGQYGDALTGWDGPLWNADYVSGSGTPAQLYPGDTWRPNHGWATGPGGWGAYSGREPQFLQFSSSATIAGLTVRDVSAFRGAVADLRSLIEGGSMTDPVYGVEIQDAYAADRAVVSGVIGGADPLTNIPWMGQMGSYPNLLWQLLRRLDAAAAADATRDAAMLAAIQALASGGTSIDTTAVIGAINAAAADTHQTITALHDTVAAQQATIAALEAKLAKAAQDAAGDLAAG